MAKKIIIDRFYGGKAEDPFNTNAIQFDKADHLDIYTNDGRMSPYRSMEADQTGQFDIGNFVFGSDSKLYGYGNPSVNATAVIYRKSGNVLTSDWEVATNGTATGGSGAVDYDMFFEYNGAIYFGKTNGRIGKYDFASPQVSDVDNWNSVTNVNGYTDGFHFNKNDTGYFAYSKTQANGGNGIASLQGSTFVSEDFVIPSRYNIAALSEYGNYLVIAGFSPKGKQGNRVFFWDTIKASADFTKDIPEGDIAAMRNIDGRLVVITVTKSATGSIDDRISVFVYDGGEFVRVKQFTGATTNPLSLRQKDTEVKYNQMFFTSNFEDNQGIYRIGLINGQWSLSLDRFATNDNSETFDSATSGAIEFVGDTVFVVHTIAGTITRTDDQSNFGATALYQTGFLDGGDKFINKRLRQVSISSDQLPSGGSIVVKAAVDGSSSFTTILTHDVDGKVKLVSTKINDLEDFSYIQFQCEITGAAVMTELTFTYDELPNERVS